MSDLREFSVSVSVHRADQSTLLSLASVLHRRGVDVVEAALARQGSGYRSFTATFVATHRQAQTVEASLSNVVNVVEAELIEMPTTGHGCGEARRSLETITAGPADGTHRALTG
jgi:acetolactate synthase regulatory subunit